MMAITKARCCVVLILLICTQYATGDFCGRFVFPTAQNDVITVRENSTVVLPFELETEECNNTVDNLKITVAKKDRFSDKFGDFCQIYHVGGNCRHSSYEEGCRCTGMTSGYEFIRTVTRSDNTTWVWLTDNNFAEEREISFIVTYPANFTDLTVSATHSEYLSNSVRAGSLVDITCQWENGNPPVEGRLVNRLGVLSKSNSSGEIRHRFSRVGCQDAGFIRCEAPGASHNKSTTLLVKCRPKFFEDNLKVITTAGQNIDLDLQVRAHSTAVSKCRATRRFSQQSGHVETHGEQIRKVQCSLAGAPPDLNLTVRLDNVRKEEEGQWRLELGNDEGSGYFDFTLTVNEPEIVETTVGIAPTTTRDKVQVTVAPENGINMGGNTGAIIGGLLGFLVIILVIIIVVIAVKKIRKRAAVVKRDQQPNNLYPLGGTERVLMRPVASLAVTDPRYMMNSTGCHVIRDLATEQVDFIPDDDYRSCFHPVLSSHMEGDEVMDDYTQAFAVPAEDQPNRRSSQLFNYRVFRVGRQFIERVRRRSSMFDDEQK